MVLKRCDVLTAQFLAIQNIADYKTFVDNSLDRHQKKTLMIMKQIHYILPNIVIVKSQADNMSKLNPYLSLMDSMAINLRFQTKYVLNP